MIKLISFSNWFYGADIILDLLSLFIILVILFSSIKYFKLNKSNSKYKYLIASFSLLSFSFLAKVLSHIVIYSHDFATKQIGIINLTYQTISHSTTLVFWGILLYRIFSLLALYLFFLIYSEHIEKRTQILIVYLLVMLGFLSHTRFFAYHLTFSVLLLLNISSLIRRNKLHKTKQTSFLITGFSILFLSQLTFTFISLAPPIYLIGEAIQLIGYSTIFIGFFKVISNGVKKKRKN